MIIKVIFLRKIFMKTLKVALLCGLMAMGGQAFAKTTTTPIVFAKGSSCGYFDGNVVGRKFTLFLQANQALTIDVDASKPIYPTVKNPKNQILRDIGHEYEYETQLKGTHSISFDVEDESYPYAEVKFCAY